MNDSIFEGVTDSREKTVILMNWIQSQGDGVIERYLLNWRIPHSLFNISCNFFSHQVLQNIDWYGIFNHHYGSFVWERELKQFIVDDQTDKPTGYNEFINENKGLLTPDDIREFTYLKKGEWIFIGLCKVERIENKKHIFVLESLEVSK